MSSLTIRPYPIAQDEESRIAALRALKVLDSDFEPAFEHIVELARKIFNVPIAAISLVDEKRQWFKAMSGLDIRETDRESAFCNYTILSDELFIVENALNDERFKNNELVTGDPKICFYAGCPLEMDEGLMAGSLCLIDQKPRRLGPKQKKALKSLGTIAASLILQYRAASKNAELSQELLLKNAKIESQSNDLQTQKRILQCASDLAKIGAWEKDCRTGKLTWSEGMYRIHEVSTEFVPSFEKLQLFYPADEYQRVLKIVSESEANNQPYTYEGRMFTATGKLRWVRVLGNIEFQDGVPVRRYGMKQDITEEKTAIEQIKRLAEVDTLTGLFNRSQLVRYISRLSECNSGFSLFLIDLDGFKEINDIHGHAAGDLCLKVVSDRINSVSVQNKFVSRVGGDEFAIVIEDLVTKADITVIAESILNVAAQPIIWRGSTLQFTISIGIAIHHHDDEMVQAELMSEADLALYEAKASGRDCFMFFEPRMRELTEKKSKILTAIRNALRQEELELYYQAKVDLSTRRIIGYEALLRWNSSEGVQTPGDFRYALEDPRLSTDIGNFVLRNALDQAALWTRSGFEFGSIAINIGPGHFKDERFADMVITEIKRRHLAPSSIEIEVTEDVFLSRGPNIVQKNCDRLRASGVRIGLDDFGTGFASLTHLLEYSVSTVKIDRSFVSGLTKRAGSAVVVKAIVDIGVSLGVDVVAEGVETEEQAAFLRKIGCKIAQGYLFHTPSPVTSLKTEICVNPIMSKLQVAPFGLTR